MPLNEKPPDGGRMRGTMQIAVISDIHSNYVALKRCIDAALAQNVRTFLFLGDYNGELASPRKTLEILYDLKESYSCYFIKGNKEEYWINYRKSKEKGWREYDSTTGCLFYTYHNLLPTDLDFFESLDYKMELAFPGLPPMTLCHGSPNRVNEKMQPNCPDTLALMERNIHPYILFGHTHRQGMIRHGEKQALNPGSVGMPSGSGGQAQFLILRGENSRFIPDFQSLDYDVEAVIDEMHTTGLNEKAPCWCQITQHLLRYGTPDHSGPLIRAMELCKESEGACHWPDIPEKYWRQSLKEAGLSS